MNIHIPNTSPAASAASERITIPSSAIGRTALAAMADEAVFGDSAESECPEAGEPVSARGVNSAAGFVLGAGRTVSIPCFRWRATSHQFMG
mgnify:CR=1 FL=1